MKKFFYQSFLLCLIFILCPITMSYRQYEYILFAKETKSVKAVKSEKDNIKQDNKNENAVQENASESGVAKEAEKKENEPQKGDYLYNYEEPQVEEESYVWLIFKTIFVMGVLIAGFYYFFKFITQKVAITAIGQEVITILSVVPLGQNKFLQVVDIAGRVYVLGVSDNNINLITEIKDKDDIDRIRLLSSKSTPPKQGGFQEYLSTQLGKVLDKMKHGKPQQRFHSQERTVHDDVILAYRQRLKKLNGDDV
ncbi:MAG: flagellar biosynthetic protein FliO [Spirochaetes bacterium]|nr:flagellar biosynthetic protein FliO [Spirochaetota bacterium]